jgi:hypothetical protein
MEADRPHLVWLNRNNLRPHNIPFWRERLPRIAAEMANRHKVFVQVSLGNFVGDDLFALNAVDLDLNDTIDATKYRFVEEKLRESSQNWRRDKLDCEPQTYLHRSR